jgi:hypothetical protein
MNTDGGVEALFHAFLTSALDGGEWSASRGCLLTPDTHCTGGWVDSRVRLNMMMKEKLLSLWKSNGQPAGSHYTAPAIPH